MALLCVQAAPNNESGQQQITYKAIASKQFICEINDQRSVKECFLLNLCLQGASAAHSPHHFCDWSMTAVSNSFLLFPLLLFDVVSMLNFSHFVFSFSFFLFFSRPHPTASPLTDDPTDSPTSTAQHSRRHASHCFLRAGSGATAHSAGSSGTERRTKRNGSRRRPPRSRCTIHHDARRSSVVHVAVHRAVACECGGRRPSRCRRSGRSAILLHRESAQHR